MTKKTCLENIDTLMEDLETGLDFAAEGRRLEWDEHSWQAMIFVLEDVRKYVKRSKIK